MPTYKLAIGNIVNAPIKFTLNDNGEDKEFEFTLKADRLSSDEISELQKDPAVTVTNFVKRVVHGWEGQKLVLDDNGTPASFSNEAFDAMLKTSGVPFVLYSGYLKACGAKEKN